MNTITYPKIDIYVNGQYVASTNKSASLAEAKTKFIANPAYMGVNGLIKLDVSASNVTCKWAT